MSDRRARHNQRRTLLRQKKSRESEFEMILQPFEFKLNNATKMPSLGVGISRFLNNSTIEEVVDKALHAGYRLFDTSSHFGNELQLQDALRKFLPKYKLHRCDVFVTTTLSPGDFGDPVRTENGFLKSYDNLGSSYIDLFLVENPGANKLILNDSSHNYMMEATWEKLIKMYDAGKVNAIGVSNFTVNMLEKLMICNHGIVPAVNKVEWHPYQSEKNLYTFCKENDIMVQADTTLGCAKAAQMMQDKVILNIAKKLEVKPSDVVLAWSLQKEVAVIPRSISVQHKEIDTIPRDFKIPDNFMTALDTLTEKNEWE